MSWWIMIKRLAFGPILTYATCTSSCAALIVSTAAYESLFVHSVREWRDAEHEITYFQKILTCCRTIGSPLQASNYIMPGQEQTDIMNHLLTMAILYYSSKAATIRVHVEFKGTQQQRQKHTNANAASKHSRAYKCTHQMRGSTATATSSASMHIRSCVRMHCAIALRLLNYKTQQNLELSQTYIITMPIWLFPSADASSCVHRAA